MVARLTPEQQEIAESRLGYAFALAHRLCYKKSLIDDARGVASLALCHAASCYKKSRNIPFPAYARRVITNSVRRWLYRQSNEITEYLTNDVPIRIDDSDVVDDADSIMKLMKCTSMSFKERMVLEAWLGGKKLSELGKEMGMTRERVRQLREQALQKIRERRGG